MGDILYERCSGDATLTPEREREIRTAMGRLLDEFGLKLIGSPANPWTVGSVVSAYTNGEGWLYLFGSGAVDQMPWADSAVGIIEIAKDREVTSIPAVAATLPDLQYINGIPISEILEMGAGAPVPEPPPGALTTWEALTNAVATAAEGAEIAVGADIDEPDGELVVPKEAAVAIRLYGKTVSCSRVVAMGALTVGDEEDSVGKIVASGGAEIARRGGSITLLSGPLRGTYTAFSPGLAVILK